jgi:hypothetical protein
VFDLNNKALSDLILGNKKKKSKTAIRRPRISRGNDEGKIYDG